MSFQQSKEFFKKLKEACKTIDNSVNEIKKKLNESSVDDEYPAAKCIINIQERIQKLQTESSELKYQLEPSLSHSTNFIQHFRELIADTEVSVTNLENHLKKYGYTPFHWWTSELANMRKRVRASRRRFQACTTNQDERERLKLIYKRGHNLYKRHIRMAKDSWRNVLTNIAVSSLSPEKRDCSPVKNECTQDDEALSKTPSLLDYGIASHGYSTSTSKYKERKSSFEDLVVPSMVQLKNRVKDKENSGSTPTLEIDVIHHTEGVKILRSTPTLEINVIHHTEEETPPLPESARNVAPFPSTQKLELRTNF